jgi:hypothetical protein
MVTVAGEEKAWAGVPKFHDLRHMIAPIARWGCIENTSGNSGELAHKALLKLAAQCNNRKQIALGIAKHNARRAALLMMDAEARHLLGREDNDSENSDSDIMRDAEKETYPCCVAVKYPLLELTFDRPASRMRIEAAGRRGEGRQKINLHTCKHDHTLTRECPALAWLPVQLAHFAFDYLWEELGLPETAEAERTIPQLDSIRLDYIDAKGKNGAHALTFGGIALESDRMAGIVRIRGRPFRSDQWYGKNPQDAVMMVPGRDVYQGNPEEFDTRNPEHFDMISYGKVVLFFNVTFKSAATGYSKLHNLCFVEELQEFTWSGAGMITLSTMSLVCII